MDTAVTPTNESSPTFIERTPPADRQKHGDKSHIAGWGADLAPEDRPAYPKERTPPRLPGLRDEPLEAQHTHVKVYHSSERPGVTPVFGTTVPPSGLSGKMRDVAFHYSENDIRHWMLLLAADRVNVGEGLISDLAHGHVPNIFKEMGLASEWKYNRAGFIRKAVVLGALAGTAVWLLRRRRDD